MLHLLLNAIDKKIVFNSASAHCDIPCKIYDPISAQLAVLTMIRMVDLLTDLKSKPELSFEDHATMTRLINEKESHGLKLKEEIRVIWGDYIKAPQLEKYPELHQLTHDIILAASFAKQYIDKPATLALLNKVNRFAEIFWQSKGVATFTAVSPYPPEQELVYPDLKA